MKYMDCTVAGAQWGIKFKILKAAPKAYLSTTLYYTCHVEQFTVFPANYLSFSH